MPVSISTLNPTTLPTVVHQDGQFYYAEGDIYDDQDGLGDDSAASAVSDPNLYNLTTSGNDEGHSDQVEDGHSYADDDDDDDTDELVYGNSMSVHRSGSKNTVTDLNKDKIIVNPSTIRPSFISSDVWQELFNKPAIVVGVVGGVVIGMLSAILLIMFIIYRMRKKDEGSYALEEGPRKSPSHAYTRVSSREFFA
ncbi:unnamed protein product [Adineta ricciae]|uniref:Syndecan n=1 Tax=Adineta ricciae TaxID=249248 RepID=A0A813QIT9_ADIRI|nr:unnamed protein product [Adineta ricciae]